LIHIRDKEENMDNITQRFLKPKEGLIVRDPKTKIPLSEAGQVKPWIGPEGRYWRRRVKVGDASIINPLQNKKKS